MKIKISKTTLGLIILILSGCMPQKTSSIQKTDIRNDVDPEKVPVPWNSLYTKNPSPEVRKFLRSSQDVQKYISTQGIPYPSHTLNTNWNQEYLQANNKYDFMHNNGVDCTRFLWHMFATEMNLPYNSKYKNSEIVSQTFATGRTNSQLKNFIPLKRYKNGFVPRTGDILAFPGHALAVLDPKQCITIQSTAWACEIINPLGECLKSTKEGKHVGVVIYKLLNKSECNNGFWIKLNSHKNKFTAGWRHKALNTWIEKIPEKAKHKQVINLVGYNISRRYIFFNGASKPVKTSYAVKTLKSHNGYPLDLVQVTVPKEALSGKIKIYWGSNIHPDINNTISSSRDLMIE